VQPLLEVLVDKSLEQSLLEVEQEHEARDMVKFKEKFYKNKKEEEADYAKLVFNEQSLLSKDTVRINEAKRNRTKFCALIQKLQCLHLAKN
jgi:cell division protein FtsL